MYDNVQVYTCISESECLEYKTDELKQSKHDIYAAYINYVSSMNVKKVRAWSRITTLLKLYNENKMCQGYQWAGQSIQSYFQ